MEQRQDHNRVAKLAENRPSEFSDAAFGARLMARFQKAGFAAADVPVLQPVEPFLELSGEDIRRRLFVAPDEDGQELCLRPEFTIPAALAYLKTGIVGRRADWAYFGPVFRHRPGETGEFFQFSAESIGRSDREAADADLLAEVLLAVQQEARAETCLVSIGDLSLFTRLLVELQLPAVLARRLALALGEGRIETLLSTTVSEPGRAEAKGLARYSGVLDALKRADPAEAKAFVKDLLSLAGISAVGGRSAEDIASRFLDRAREEQPALSAEQVEIIRRFLAISGDPDTVASSLRKWADDAGLDFAAVIDRFELRSGFLEARGLDLAQIEASAGFARNLDYYSGFVFEIRREAGARPLAGGGRYDRLFERLGHDVPALGAAIWIERLIAEETAL
jgi:ATP phosphoribosyltransferase regulatory subunit